MRGRICGGVCLSLFFVLWCEFLLVRMPANSHPDMVATEERKIAARKSAAEHEKSANKSKSTKSKPAEQDVD